MLAHPIRARPARARARRSSLKLELRGLGPYLAAWAALLVLALLVGVRHGRALRLLAPGYRAMPRGPRPGPRPSPWRRRRWSRSERCRTAASGWRRPAGRTTSSTAQGRPLPASALANIRRRRSSTCRGPVLARVAPGPRRDLRVPRARWPRPAGAAPSRSPPGTRWRSWRWSRSRSWSCSGRGRSWAPRQIALAFAAGPGGATLSLRAPSWRRQGFSSPWWARPSATTGSSPKIGEGGMGVVYLAEHPLSAARPR